MTTLGMVYVPQWPPERLREVAVAADEAGLEELWLWEDCFLEGGIASAAAALAWTTRLRVGVGLLPVPLRNVALTAMEIATLHRMFPDRVLVGVGHGVQDWMAQVGARAESPMTLLREYITALRALLRGERVTTQGRYVNLDGVALDWPPHTEPPIYVGAVGPRTTQLAAELATGTIVTGGTPPSRLPTRAGDVVVYVHAATGTDAEARIERERVRWGQESMHDISAVGDANTFAQVIDRYVAAGATSVILQPTPDDPDPAAFIRFITREVRPLVD